MAERSPVGPYYDDFGLPYPPVFRDWQHPDERVATVSDATGIAVEMMVENGAWKRVVLTENDACLLAASLLLRANKKKLCKRVVRAVRRSS